MAIIKIKTKIELSEKELTGFRAAIEKMGLAPEEAVKLFFNEAVKLLAEKYSVTPQKKMKVEQVAAKPSKAVKAQKKAVEKAEEKSVKTILSGGARVKRRRSEDSRAQSSVFLSTLL